MSNAYALAGPAPSLDLAPVTLEPAAQAAADFAANSKAPNTLRAYASDWRHFCAWCDARGLCPLPAQPEAVAVYLADLATQGRRTATIGRRVSSISQAHQLAGHETPTASAQVRAVLAGIRRTLGVAQQGKAPVRVEDLRAMLPAVGGDMRALRDRALLLLGFAGGFRRSELVALDVPDLTASAAGLTVILRRSKTDQLGEGRVVGIPFGGHVETCPVRAAQAWLKASAVTAGPVFRRVDRYGRVGARRLTAASVALVVKRAVARVGLDPDEYGGHSLRAGLATSAAAAGASSLSIMRTTGHRSHAMVARYVRVATVFDDNAASAVGL